MVSITKDELLIISQLKRRLFIPLDVIVNIIFNGNAEEAKKTIRVLIDRKLVEYAQNGRLTITASGKNIAQGQRNQCWGIAVKTKVTTVLTTE